VAKLKGEKSIEIWGDGEQTRSFCYVDDCVEGVRRLMDSDFPGPVNLGQDRLVSINQLADMIMQMAGVKLEKKHVAGALGVRGRNSDNTLVRKMLQWEPKVALEEGLARTYSWIEGLVKARLAEGKPIES
jgi:GDP-D-mannose 3',5'-epimerase